MRLFFHFSIAGFSNTYLLGGDKGGDAIVIDPGVMNLPLLELIENNEYYVRSVLITHCHASHFQGLKTLRRIYDAQIFAYNDRVLDFDCTPIRGGTTVDVSGFEVQIIEVPGHSGDSLVFRIEDFLFTGDTLEAGTIAATESAFARELLLRAISERLLGLEGNCLVFPGHGAPTTLEVERKVNPFFTMKPAEITNP